MLDKGLISIFNRLPQLDSLKIDDWNYPPSTTFMSKDFHLLRSLLATTKMTKLYLEEIPFIKESSNVYCVYHSLLSQETSKRALQLLCLKIRTVDEQMIKQLKKMICVQELVQILTIKRIYDQIYLHWK